MRLYELRNKYLRAYGHFKNEEIFEMKKDGWQVVWKEAKGRLANRKGVNQDGANYNR